MDLGSCSLAGVLRSDGLPEGGAPIGRERSSENTDNKPGRQFNAAMVATRMVRIGADHGGPMADIRLEKLTAAEDRALPVFAEVEEVLERIRQRAYALFEGRGFGEGHALDDWLAAEREICWPATEFVENDAGFELSVALAGFEPADIAVTATPRELIVKALHRTERREAAAPGAGAIRWSEFRSNDVYRRIEFPAAVDVAKLSATFRNGLLKVVAPKARKVGAAKPAEVAIAA
jgi:HSP20 family molecular chaperone IbpA